MFLYDHWFIDSVAIALFAALVMWAAITAWRLVKKLRLRQANEAWKILAAAGPATIAIIALLLTYSTVRLQTRLSAEVAHNQLGEGVVSRETEHFEFRCLYNWHAYNNPIACRAKVLANADSYTRTMLYIEETLFLLETARADKRYWGSGYASDVKYWADDVSEDPTGLFSYNIIVENPENPAEAAREMGLSISPSRLCQNYRIVREELVARGARPSPEISWCSTETR